MIITAFLILLTYLHTRILDYFYRKPSAGKKSNNKQLNDCLSRKKEILGTIEAFNSPSTFVQYSKLQRELNKVQQRIGVLNGIEEAEPCGRMLSRGRANILYIGSVLFLSSLIVVGRVNVEQVSMPVSLLVNGRGQINGVFVVLVSKLLFVL